MKTGNYMPPRVLFDTNVTWVKRFELKSIVDALSSAKRARRKDSADDWLDF